MDCQRGTKIVLDEERIMKEGKYNIEELCKEIDEMAENAGLIKKDKLLYMCKGDEKDLARLGIFNYKNLSKKEWFTKNVKEWIWLNNNEGNGNIIEICKEYKIGVWS